MASNASIQQYINDSADPALAVYSSSAQTVPVMSGNTSVYITNTTEYIVNKISGPAEPAGNTSEIQFNRSGTMGADDGLTYNPTTDSLTVNGNLNAGYILTNNLKYANGANWDFGSGYSNTNVFAYLPTYVGNLNPGNVTATLFSGSGANLTNIPAGNIVGSVAVASVANSVAGANVTGTVSKATVADTANAVAGGNVTGTVSSATSATTATRAGTVTTAAQPNITSLGSLTGLVVSNVSGVVDFTTTANVTLGAVGNLHITGGTNGQVLGTSGSGTLLWTTPSAGNLQDITTNGSNTDRAIYISNTTVSSSYTTGALKVSGGVGIGGNIHINGQLAANGTIYAGHLADFGSWVNPVIVGRDTGSDYIQGALVNINPNGSADWVAYNDTSDEDGGASAWTDMGYTGSTFSDPLYTITEANDGYLFVQGKVGASGGNLVIATGEKGAHKDLVFATGGFLSNNESMRLDHERDIFFIGGHAHSGLSDRVIDLNLNGNAIVGGNLTPNANVTSNLGSSSNQFKNIYAGNITLSGSGTSINAGSGNITTNIVTGTKFNFLHGSYSSLLQGNVSATSNLTFTLPSSAGTSGQLLSTDGVGNLGWSNPPKAVPDFTIAYATFTSEIGKRYIVDTLTQVANTVLPTSPTIGQALEFVDAFSSFDTYPLTIEKSDKNILGGSSYVCNIMGSHITLVYNGQEWRVFAG